MDGTIFLRTSREATKQAIIDVIKSVGGSASAHTELARGVHTAVGMAALSDIKNDFITKARGGTGEDGITWPPLSPKYLAYNRRFGPGERAGLKKAAGLGRGNNNRGLLSKAQDRRWRQIFASVFARLSASLPEAAAKARAGQAAWATLKREGAKTMLEVFGNRTVEILRDTGVLFNSLSVGEIAPSGDYSPPADQIFALTESGVIVGTNVVYARAHNRGVPSKNLPARQFIPVDGAPQVWLDRWQATAATAVSAAIQHALRIGGAA